MAATKTAPAPLPAARPAWINGLFAFLIAMTFRPFPRPAAGAAVAA